MIHPLEISALSKNFETSSGIYPAVKDFNVSIENGEFVSIVGHSGCGKSTVLSIVAGLQKATLGGVCIDGREVREPGRDRGVVFQSPSLLPWLSALENVALAAGQAFPSLSTNRQKEHAHQYLALVGVDEFWNQKPGELSLGTQQRVAIARALVLEPRFLLLDEPFGMLDSLTRFELQDVLLQVWEKNRKIVVMVTHDVDEALYLSDRILLMTDGPEATLGEVLKVPFARPRQRNAVLEHPTYYRCRSQVIDFLEHHAHQAGQRVA
ncbi:MAG: ABC transporter ATP-binding protein [Acidobacteria bacterium]|nr:ABC transporter ATP-binding protein [Acidobacteriota bacterium]MCI0720359.1 ABC transporter ATP-binding protein [Acidobacteriota bacterium]